MTMRITINKLRTTETTRQPLIGTWAHAKVLVCTCWSKRTESP
jgi:hypothetical protein